MAVCVLCSSLDDKQVFQEEMRELSWITEDISVLYKENSGMIEKIKKLNLELEEFISYEDTKDELEDNADFPDVKTMWLVKEEMLRATLVQQFGHLCQDVITLHQPGHGHQDLPVHRQLWGHRTLQWHPPVSDKTRRPGKLLRWILRRMPNQMINNS